MCAHARTPLTHYVTNGRQDARREQTRCHVRAADVLRERERVASRAAPQSSSGASHDSLIPSESYSCARAGGGVCACARAGRDAHAGNWGASRSAHARQPRGCHRGARASPAHTERSRPRALAGSHPPRAAHLALSFALPGGEYGRHALHRHRDRVHGAKLVVLLDLHLHVVLAGDLHVLPDNADDVALRRGPARRRGRRGRMGRGPRGGGRQRVRASSARRARIGVRTPLARIGDHPPLPIPPLRRGRSWRRPRSRRSAPSSR